MEQKQKKEKRCYSLNKVAYLLQFLKPDYIGYDDQTRAVYYVFPDNDKVLKLIKNFYDDKKLHRYLHDPDLQSFTKSYNHVIKTIKQKKYENLNTIAEEEA